jgi:hypothetical protein
VSAEPAAAMADLYILLELNRDPGLREALGKMLDLPPPDTSSRAPSLQEVKDAVAALGRTRFHTGPTHAGYRRRREQGSERLFRDALGEVAGDGGGPASARR